MKFIGKKVIALIIALMMCSTMVVGFAEGEVAAIEITKVELLDSDGEVEDTYTGDDIDTATISLDSAQMLRVTAQVTDVANAQVSFLSYETPKDGSDASYTNDTIQYLDQVAASDNVAIFTFRPRASLGTGTFVAMTGATSVAEADRFTYKVEDSTPTLSITATDAKAEFGKEDDTVMFTIASSDSILPTADALSVYVDYADEQSVALAKDGTAYTYDAETGVIVILNAAVGSVGNHTATVSAEGYNMPATPANYTVTAFVESPLEGEEEEKAAQDAVNEINHTVEKTEGYQKIDMANTEIQIGEFDKTVAVKHTFNYDNNDGALSVQDGKLVYDESARTKFASNVTITSAVVGDDDVSKTQTIYFIPDDVQISFGNLTALAKSDNPMEDAFASDAGIAAISTGDKSDALTIALNVTMGRGTFNDVARATDTIDYVKDGKFVLAEYRIIKLLMDGEYTYDEVYNAREGWQPQP